MLGLVLLIGALPEIPLHHFLLPQRDWWFALILDAAVLYSAAWVLGVYGCMVLRPHDIGDERITLHFSPFAEVHIERAHIRSAVPMAAPDRRALRRSYPDAVRLLCPGADCVHITLREPARVVRMFPVRQQRSALEVFVSSDRPRELCALLGG